MKYWCRSEQMNATIGLRVVLLKSILKVQICQSGNKLSFSFNHNNFLNNSYVCDKPFVP